MFKQILTIFSFCILSFAVQAQDQSVKSSAQTNDAADKIFTTVEKEAVFPGGINAWRDYLQENLKANIPVKRKAPVGTYTVVVKFVVSKDGSISDIYPETSNGYGMEQEVVRVIKKGPDWIPAEQRGRKVNAYRRQPITFVVEAK